MWEPSLYVGGLALVLALSAAGFRGRPPWRAWLTAVAAVGLLASFGKFAGPLWSARWIPAFASALGPHDPADLAARADAYPLDAMGSPYELLSGLIPGFGLFRYPAKLLTLTAAAVAVLAGAGWDELAAGRSKRFVRACLPAFVSSAAALALALALRAHLAFLAGRDLVQEDIGPANVAAAWTETQWALVHGLFLYAAALFLAAWVPRRPGQAGAMALVVLTLDLGLSSGRLIWTVPQSAFDTEPEAARRIGAVEQDHPSPGPFRVHRMAGWHPRRFQQRGSHERLRELIAWNRATLTPLSGLPDGLEYCMTAGAIGLDDYQTIFTPMKLIVLEGAARSLKIEPGRSIYYHPRRAYDLWGARYFILPIRNTGWATAERAFASFLSDVEVVYPKRDDLDEKSGLKAWSDREDWQLLRNKAAYPRPWIVHNAFLLPVSGADDRDGLVRTLVYPGDRFWSERDWPVYDLRSMAWIETSDGDALHAYLSRSPVEPDESVTVTRYDPQRVELKARLNHPGFVILADTVYPGWRLTIDGHPRPSSAPTGRCGERPSSAGSILWFTPTSPRRSGPAWRSRRWASRHCWRCGIRSRPRERQGRERRERSRASATRERRGPRPASSSSRTLSRNSRRSPRRRTWCRTPTTSASRCCS